jgi:uncharacterized membrane protein
VLTSNRELMAQARSSLKDKWGIAVIGTLVYVLMRCVINLTPVVKYFLPLLLEGVLTLGYVTYILSIVRNKQPITLELLFSGFSRFWTAFCAMLLVVLFIVLWALPGVIAAASLGAVYSLFFHITWTPLTTGIGYAIILPLVFILPALAFYRYSLTYFIIVDNPNISAFGALKLSKTMLKGNLKKRIYLDCRFTGWFLLALVSLCIGFLWFTPYWQASVIHFYEDIKRDYEEKQVPEISVHGNPCEVTDYTT